MKFASAFLFLITAASAAFAQDIALNQGHGDEVAITKDTFLLRYQKHDFNATADVGIASSCLLVYPDGKFRFERERQEYNDRQPITRVYEGQVDGNDLARLRDIVSNQDFRSVRVIPQGNTIRSNESFTVDVLRGDGAQRFMITDDTRRRYDKPLKPFLEWERSLERRKVPENKSAHANGCQFPRRIQMPVAYRSRILTSRRRDPASGLGSDSTHLPVGLSAPFVPVLHLKWFTDGPGRGCLRKSI